MDAHFDPDVAGDKQPPKKGLAVATIALSALFGVAGGFGAFGIANAIQDDNSSNVASSADTSAQTNENTNSPEAERAARAEGPPTTLPTVSSLVPVSSTPRTPSSEARATSTRTVTSVRTQTTEAGAPGYSDPAPRRVDNSGANDDATSDDAQSRNTANPTTTAGANAERATGAGREEEGTVNAANMTVVPTPVERPIERTTTVNTPTPQPSPGATTTTVAPTTTVQVRQPGNEPNAAPGQNPNNPGNGNAEQATPAGENGAQPPAAPAGPPPAPDRATNQELDGVLRAATSPATEDRDRIAAFEQGEAARPVIERFMGVSTGSVPLIDWYLQGPVQVVDGRAETRLQLRTVLPSPSYPAIFVWRDGAWRVSAETTCVLARAMAMPCP